MKQKIGYISLSIIFALILSFTSLAFAAESSESVSNLVIIDKEANKITVFDGSKKWDFILNPNTAINQNEKKVEALHNCNLRKGPGTQYEVIRVIPVGASLTILSESGDWYQVEYRSSNEIHFGYITKYLVGTQSNPGMIPLTPPQSPKISNLVHVVQAGDSLWKIAQKYKATVDDIIKLNSLNQNSSIYIGQKLTLPTTGSVKPLVQPQTSTPVVHVVQAGDSLWKIAQKYRATVDAIVKLNNLNQNSSLFIGQKLTIQTAGSVKPLVQPQTSTPVVHVVQAGDSLWKISQKYKATVDGIIKLNSLNQSSSLFVGQRLIIRR